MDAATRHTNKHFYIENNNNVLILFLHKVMGCIFLTIHHCKISLFLSMYQIKKDAQREYYKNLVEDSELIFFVNVQIMNALGRLLLVRYFTFSRHLTLSGLGSRSVH